MAKTRTTVGTSISRAIDDKLLPNSIRSAIEHSVLKNTEMTEYMVAGLGDSIAARAHRMLEFAQDGHYVHGVPRGAFYTPAETGEEAVMTVLRSIEGAGVDVVLEYLHYSVPNDLHYGWTRLVAEYGYDTETNQLGVLSAVKGQAVFLEDMVVVASTAGVDTASLKQWGIAPLAGATPGRPAPSLPAKSLVLHSPVEVAPAGEPDHLRVTYVWGAADNLQRETLKIYVAGLNEAVYFFHAAYTANGKRKFFFYEDGAGTHVLLDQLFDAEPVASGSFFPFVYFRYAKKSELDDKDSESYKTGKRLLNHLGMDFDQVAEAVDANPDIADVEQAMLMMAVPANTENAMERRYLWDFFNNMFLTQAPAQQQASAGSGVLGELLNKFSGLANPGIAIQDNRFKMWLDNEGLYKRRVAGKLGKIGTYDSGFESAQRQLEFLDPETGQMITVATPSGHHYYRRQVSSAFYDEIVVVGMRTVSEIYESHSTIGDEEDRILLVPLDYAITRRYSMPKREELYSRSLHYIFNSRVTSKVKWYQTGLFKAVLIVVAVVIAVVSYGTLATEAYALIAAGSYAAAAYLVMIQVLQAIVMRLLFKVLVRAVGAEAAFLIAVLAVAAGVADIANSGSLSGAPFAKDLLMLSTGLSNAVGAQMKSDMAGLSREYEELDALNKERNALLEAANDLLGDVTRLDPMIIFGESPSEYYARTVHSGNIGVLSIGAVSEFVSMKLTLPTLKESLGGFADE